MPDLAKDVRLSPATMRVPGDRHLPPPPTPVTRPPRHPRQEAIELATGDPRMIAERARAKAAAVRHSRFVRLAKIGLPILGVLIASVVLGRYWLVTRFAGLNLPTVLFSKNGLTMVEPRMTGRSRDRAYDIGATRATQDFSSPKVFNLEQLSGRVEMSDTSWAKIESRTGVYDGNTDGMTLKGAVMVTTSTGYVLRGEDADIELSKGNMKTDNPVHIVGPTGWLDAGAARVTDGGSTIQFSKGVHMTIRSESVPPLPGLDRPIGTETAQ